MSETFFGTLLAELDEKDEILETIYDALQSELARSVKQMEMFKKQCGFFEKKCGLSSELFLEKFQKGNFHNKSEYFDWFAAKTGFDVWCRKIIVLKAANSLKLEIKHSSVSGQCKHPRVYKNVCSKKYSTYTL